MLEALEDRKVLMANQEIVKDILGALVATNRNIISDEFEEGLQILSKHINLKIHRYKSGAECWTWNIPQKWNVRKAHIKKGDECIVSWDDHPLHVMSYSTPVNTLMKGVELKKHIYTHRELPEAIPYEFSFYEPKWGFCLTREQLFRIKDDEEYEVVIDSQFVDDHLSVGEYTIQGSSQEHIFFLSHLDHPFQANDGLVGVAANVALAKMLAQQKEHYYNYTFLFMPETIGSIAFLSHHEKLIPHIRYAVFVEMVGFNDPMIFQRSFKDRGLINQYASYVLRKKQGEAKSYPFLTVAGNDEKVFDAPGVNVPSISLTRLDHDAKLATLAKGTSTIVYPYPQYHSHLDDMTLIHTESVCGTVDALYDLCHVIERDFLPKRTFKGPVFLTKYGLWADWRTDMKANANMMWLMYALEGDKTAFQIAEELDWDFEQVVEILDKFYDNGLITKERVPIEFDRGSEKSSYR